MPDYPQTPVPSSVSAPEYIDEILRFSTDSGYEVRRAKHSRPRRRFVLDYLGKSTSEMHTIRDFFGTLRFGLLPFSWWHPTAIEDVVFLNTTPIIISFNGAHGLMTGSMLGIFTSPGGNARNGFYSISRVNSIQVSLNGSAAGGAGVGSARVYLPNAVGVFSEDTMAAPVKLGGPETTTRQGAMLDGYWNFSVTIEEIF